MKWCSSNLVVDVVLFAPDNLASLNPIQSAFVIFVFHLSLSSIPPLIFSIDYLPSCHGLYDCLFLSLDILISIGFYCTWGR